MSTNELTELEFMQQSLALLTRIETDFKEIEKRATAILDGVTTAEALLTDFSDGDRADPAKVPEARSVLRRALGR